MKIILSRKGFDSSNGGMPSPIFPDGKIISLPIPAECSPTKLSDLNYNDYDIAEIVSKLSNNKIKPHQYVHLDPDLDYQALPNRPTGWRGAFGQVGAAQKHLSNNNIGRGDLFIYFGWFREVEQHNHTWRFKPNSQDLHIVYGWLFVEDVISVFGKEKDILRKYPWLERHPHLHLPSSKDPHNTIYIGNQTLPFGSSTNTLVTGVFRSIRDIQILTDTTQQNRSLWKLPACFYPEGNKPPLSYHTKKERWKILNNKMVTLKSVGRGQEFVLDTKYYPGVNEWLEELFS